MYAQEPKNSIWGQPNLLSQHSNKYTKQTKIVYLLKIYRTIEKITNENYTERFLPPNLSG